MSPTKVPLPSSRLKSGAEVVFLPKNLCVLYRKPSRLSTAMWRNVTKQLVSRTSRSGANVSVRSFLGLPQESTAPEKFNFKLKPFDSCPASSSSLYEVGVRRNGEILSNEDPLMGRSSCFHVGLSGICPKGYTSVAEAVVSSTDAEEDVSVSDEVQELLEEMSRSEKKEREILRRKRLEIERGIGSKKYNMLRKRQVKTECEAWEQAAKEYKELLSDMCEHKLAPNLPYMKALFLGWFEPLCNAIASEQELYRSGKNRMGYAPYFDQLPADMMSVITMHKLMGLLMTGGEHGVARVIRAACAIGDAIEQEVG